MKNGARWMVEDVLGEVRAHLGRVLIAFAAIATGVAALSAVTAVLTGLADEARHMTSELGADVVAILPPPDAGHRPGTLLEVRHASFLARNLPSHLVSTVRRFEVAVSGGARVLTVVATDNLLAQVRQWRLRDGRFLDEEDMARRERNAVVSLAAADAMGVRVGEVIRLRGLPFRVVGIVEVGGGSLEAELGTDAALGDRVVFVPRTVEPNWSYQTRMPFTAVDAIFVRAPQSVGAERTVGLTEALFTQPDVRVIGASFVTPQTLVRGLNRLRTTLKLTVGAISVFCLLLGGTTLMSLMMASVRERIAEIGLRRALGASKRDIVLLFVLEGCLISFCAAALGSVVAHVTLSLARGLLPLPLHLGGWSLFLPLGSAVALGVLFSFWPARQAALIEPCEALRS